MHQSMDPEEAERFEKLAEAFRRHKDIITQGRDQMMLAKLLMTVGRGEGVEPESSLRIQQQGKGIGENGQRLIKVGRTMLLREMELHGLEPFLMSGRIYLPMGFKQMTALPRMRTGDSPSSHG